MTKNNLHLATVTAGALAFCAAGCLLGSDPNMNSSIYNPNPDAPIAGVGGNGGGGNGGSGNVTGPIVGVPLATFDNNSEGFSFSTYDEPTNLAVHYGDMGPPSLQFDGADGSPDNGSLKVFAPYSNANQYVDIQSKSYAATDLRNFKGGKLHVRIKVDTGSTFNGQVEPYVDTTSGYVFVGTSINIRMGHDWQDYVVDLDNAMTQNSGYDLTKVILFGAHIGSGSAGASQKAVTFHVDSFSVEGIAAPPTPDAGPTDTAPPDAGTTSADAGTD
jgi:hypothetical protein